MWIVLLVVISFGSLYVLLTRHVRRLQKAIDDQNAKITELQKQLSGAKPKSAAPTASSVAPTTLSTPAKTTTTVATPAAAATPAATSATVAATPDAKSSKPIKRTDQTQDVTVSVSGLGTMGGSVRVVPPTAAASSSSAPSSSSKKGHRRARSTDLTTPDSGVDLLAETDAHSRRLSSRSERSPASRKTPSTPQEIHPPVNPSAIVKKGDLHFGTRMPGLRTRRWHRRTFILHKDGWLGFRGKKSGKTGKSDYVAWIYVPRCKIFREGERQLRILARCPPLFFPHPGVKPSKKFGSTDCLLRTLDATSAEEWSRELSKIPTDPALIDVDEILAQEASNEFSDEDIESEDELTEELDTNANDRSSMRSSSLMPVSAPHFIDDGRAQSSPGIAHESSEAASSTPVRPLIASTSEAAIPRRQELVRQESLLIRDPDASQPVEVPLSDATEDKQGLFAMLKKAVGSDLTTISMPISVHEPTTFLQRMAEGLQYHQLLEEAGRTDDPNRQIMLTAAFAVAAYSCNVRTYKPFNPYLGETYQFDDGNVRFFAEQVSHHPPIGACVLEGSSFIFWQDMCVQTKFGGNQLDVSPTGEWHVRFKNNNNHITWLGVKTVVYSIIVGTMWIDCHGKTELVSLTSGEKARVDMTKCGWFNKGRWETSCEVLNRNGKKAGGFTGKWNSELKDLNGETIWRNTLGAARPDDKYQRPDHVFDLIANPPEILQRLPPSDSRFRKDLLALQANDSARASTEKKALEQHQRALRADREKRGEEYRPRWFEKAPAPGTGNPMWLFNGEYWTQHGASETNQRLGPGPNFLAE